MKLRSHRTRSEGESESNVVTATGSRSEKKFQKSDFPLTFKQHLDEKPFDCTFCNHSCKLRGDLNRHHRVHAGETPFKCPKNPASFNSRPSFGHHVNRQHPEEYEYQAGNPNTKFLNVTPSGFRFKKFKCQFCEYVTGYISHLKVHIRTHTGEKPFVCELCNYACEKPSGLKKHRRCHAGETPFKCQECPAAFNTRMSLALHFARQHEERGPDGLEPFPRRSSKGDSTVCRFCPKVFRCVAKKQVHERTHTGERPFKCTKCSSDFTEKSNLKDHMLVHADTTKRFKCDFCDYASHQKYNLAVHVRRHTGEKPYKCNLCKATFRQSGGLKAHMDVHYKINNYKCEHCSYATCSMGALKKHIRTHTSERPFECKLCSFTSSTPGTLKSHTRIHTGEKPFKCNLCDAKFTTCSYLKVHLNVHNKIENYKCELCEYATCTSGHLKRHIRIHTGEKPFACKFCSYTCNTSGSLKAHIRIHTGEKPFKCNLCDYSSAYSRSIKRHRLAMHP